MTLNTKKVNTDQNLVSKKLVYKYMYQRCSIPALVMIILIVAVSFLAYYGIPRITQYFIDQEYYLSSQSLADSNATNAQILSDKEAELAAKQEEYDNFYINNPIEVEVDDSILTILKDDIARLEQELRELQESNSIPIFEKYPINELMNYLEDNRPKTVGIISIEDVNSQGSSGESFLIYQNDLGQATFNIHGMATSSADLADFFTAIQNCPYLLSSNIVSVETQTMDDSSNLYVFEISLTPLVTVKGE